MAVATRSGGRTSQGQGPAPDRYVPPGRIQGGASSPGRTRAPARAPASSRTPSRQGSNRRRQAPSIAPAAARTSRRAAAPSYTDYQKVIAAEFVIAELLVAATPFASKKATGLSPYIPRDMTKMLALGGLYFLLELLSIPAGWGRFMAWFGGLILLTVGLNEAANITKDIDIFAGINPKSTKPVGGSGA